MADISTGPWRSDMFSGKPNQGNAETCQTRTRPKSRLGSYLSSHRSNLSLEKLDSQAFVRLVPRSGDDVYSPEPEQMITTMLTRLLGRPAEGLPPEHNSFLMHVFESYRNLQREVENLYQKLDMETHACRDLAVQFERVEALRLEDKQTYTVEIRRLQSLLAYPDFTVPVSTGPGYDSSIEERPANTLTLVEKTLGGGWKGLERRTGKSFLTVDCKFAHCFSTGDPLLTE